MIFAKAFSGVPLIFKSSAGSLIFLVFLFFAVDVKSQELQINEIMASNNETIADDFGEYSDWIEIYNKGNEPVGMSAFSLTDSKDPDPDERFKWVFPDTTLMPGDFLLVWASGKDRSIPGKPLHTNFNISRDGNYLILANIFDGDILDEVPPVRIDTDLSYGRYPDGAEDWFYFTDPTPDASNSLSNPDYTGYVEPPELSHQPGFFAEEFELQITHPDPAATIYYTLDSSDPDEHSETDSTVALQMRNRSDDPKMFSTIVTSNIHTGSRAFQPPQTKIAKANVVRLKIIRDDLISYETTLTYFVFPEGANRYRLPVISIVSDSTNLFSDEDGIYVPGDNTSVGTGNYEESWERPARFTWFDENGSIALDHGIGIRIHGGFTRRFPQKSLRLYARNIYGENRFRKQVFPDVDDDVFNRLILRQSGNDWGHSMFMDAAAQELVRHFNVDTQAYLPSVVFLNGEYWGIHNFRERYDKHYLERVYGVDPENIDLLTSHRIVKEGDAAHYDGLLNLVENYDASDNEVFSDIKTMMDLDNYIDYYSAQIYYGNNDWPHNNIDYWRKKVPYDPDAPAGHDGRWRWLLYDVDRSLSNFTASNFDMIEWVLMERDGRFNSFWPNRIFRSLMENETFKYRMVNRLADHLNTSFAPDQVVGVVDSLKNRIVDDIDEHIDRWPQPQNRAQWDNRVALMKAYGNNRPDFVRNHMAYHLDIGEQAAMNFEVNDPEAGYIQVNDAPVITGYPGIPSDPYPWEGVYFTGVPVTIRANSLGEFIFMNWEIHDSFYSDKPEITVTPEEQLTIRAVFDKRETGNDEETDARPSAFKLHANYPNPFNNSTVVRFDLPETSWVRLEVYDISGRRVAILEDDVREAGVHRVNFDASGLASGVYLYRLRAGSFVASKKMLLIQ